MTEQFPEIIQALPDADIPLEGVRAKLLQAGDYQIVFFDIDPIGEIPPHSHGAQWGFVIEGEVILTIGGKTKTYTKGDTYYIPPGVVHYASFPTHFRAMDMFAEPNRYKPRQ